MDALKWLHYVVPFIVVIVTSTSGECILRCHIPIKVDPKCGSNGVTYQNTEELLCAKSLCYPDLIFVHNGHCDENSTAQETPKIARRIPSAAPSKINNIPIIATTPLPDLKKLATYGGMKKMRPFPSSSIVLQNADKLAKCNLEECTCEYILSPVCGSDGVTYGNQCILDCAQKCDSKISLHHTGFCGRIFFTTPLLHQIGFFTFLNRPSLALADFDNELE